MFIHFCKTLITTNVGRKTKVGRGTDEQCSSVSFPTNVGRKIES